MPPKKTAPTKPSAGPTALDKARSFLSAQKNSSITKDTFVQVDENEHRESLPHFSSGSIIIDFLIGGKPNRYGVMPCPGLPRGRVVQVYGQPSAGKTTFALTASASIIKQGGTVCYIDYENAISIPYAKALGVPVEDSSRFILAQPMTVEEGADILNAMAMAGVDLIVVDSVGEGVFAAERAQQFDKDAKGAGLGAHARYWSENLPIIRGYIGKSQSCLLGISQVRTNIKASSGPGELHMARGGVAWQFNSDVRIYLRVVMKEKSRVYDALTHTNTDKTVATTVKAEIKKSRISGSQGLDADFHIRFGEGIDDAQSIIDVATAHGIIKKGGAWYTWERASGTEVRGQGKEALRSTLINDPAAWEEMRKVIMTKLAVAANTPQKVVQEDDVVSDLLEIEDPPAAATED